MELRADPPPLCPAVLPIAIFMISFWAHLEA
jgi:hypothetical protein